MKRLVLVLVAVAGCTSLPQTRRPPAAPLVEGAGLPHRVCVAPIRIVVSEEERKKGYSLAPLTDSGKVAAEVERWLVASGAFARVRVASGEETPLDDAWREREDLLLEASLRDLSVAFEGHNGWWGPNLGLWFMLMVPAWFVATEKYAFTFEVEWRLRSVDSGRTLAQGTRDVRMQGTLDEMDRGWQLLGFLRPKNDADNWRKIAALFVEAARAEAAAAITDDLMQEYVPRARTPELRDQMRKTMAVVVGVSEYRNPLRAPPLPYAASDARAVAQALADRLGVPPRHMTLLLDRAATKEKIAAAVADLRARTHPGDQLVFYFAGYGTRGAGGRALLTSEAEPLPLAEMAALLRGLEGEGLVLLDCSFDGRGRSIRGRAPGPDAGDLDGMGAVATTILAADAGDHLVTPEQVHASLFAFHVLRSLRGEADREPDGVVTPGELYKFVHENVVADAAFYGKRQRPRAAGLERAVALRLRGASK